MERKMYDIIYIKNVDSKPFLIEYNTSDMENGVTAWMKPGETRSMPRFLADHVLPHMIDQICNNSGVSTANQAKRNEFAGQIVMGEDTFNYAPIQTPEQVAMAKADEINKTSQLDSILAKRKAAETQTPPENDPGMLPELDEEGREVRRGRTVPAPTPVEAVPAPTPAPVPQEAPVTPAPATPNATPLPETVAGTTVASVEATAQPEVPVNEPAPDLGPVDPNNPSREALYKYATDVLKMDMTDKKTLVVYENMSVPELVKELDYTPNP